MPDLKWKSWKLFTAWAILFNISCAVWEWPLFELGPFLLRINEPFCHICVKSFELQPCLDHWPLLMKAALLVLFLCSKVASKSFIKVGSTKSLFDQGRKCKWFFGQVPDTRIYKMDTVSNNSYRFWADLFIDSHV